MSDSNLKIHVIGARNGYGKASGNVINIYGGKLNGYVIAAVFNDYTREHTPIFGTNNTLNFYTKNIDVTELNGFNNYNFYLPDSITHRDIVLNVIGDKVTDISGSTQYDGVNGSDVRRNGKPIPRQFTT